MIASSVSDTEPIWLSLIRIQFAHPISIPFASLSVFVTNRSSPTSWTLSPSLAVSFCHPSQSSSSRPSSIEMIGYFSTSFAQCSMSCSAVYSVPAFGSLYQPLPFSLFHSDEAASIAIIKSLPGSYPAFFTASSIVSIASSSDLSAGANPPSSPTDVARPLSLRIPASAWNTSAHHLRHSLNEGAPTGMIMNS